VPTVHRLRGYRVEIYTRDQDPPHIHVTGGGRLGIWLLSCPREPVSVRVLHGINGAEARSLETELNRLVPFLCSRWIEVHERRT
jgi:hypothetical protein